MTKDEGESAVVSSSPGVGADVSRASPSAGEGTSTGSRELDGGVLWQEELAFIAGLGQIEITVQSRVDLAKVAGTVWWERSREQKIREDFRRPLWGDRRL
jgi:hypothetical protein